MPCDVWVTSADVAACGVDPALYDAALVTDVLAAASAWTFRMSGQRWTGVCTSTERPCGCSCRCDQVCRCDSLCQCQTADTVALTYGPVVGTPTVTIDGAPFSMFAVIAPNMLARTDGHRWPSCQVYEQGPSEGWIVTYDHGVIPPVLAVMAAAEVASEMLRACAGDVCALPAGTVAVTRRGVSIDLDADKAAAALPRVAMLLGSYPPRRSPPVVRDGSRGLITSGPA